MTDCEAMTEYFIRALELDRLIPVQYNESTSPFFKIDRHTLDSGMLDLKTTERLFEAQNRGMRKRRPKDGTKSKPKNGAPKKIASRFVV